MTITVEKLKDWGYTLSVPIVASILFFLYTQYRELHIKEIQLLKQEVENLKTDKNMKSYSLAYSELSSQKKLYEEKIKKTYNDLEKTKLTADEIISKKDER